jgi:hypothetical protein
MKQYMSQSKLRRRYKIKKTVAIAIRTHSSPNVHEGMKCFKEAPGTAGNESSENAHDLFVYYTSSVIADNIIYAR